MHLNALRIRVGLLGAGIVTLLIFFAMGGRLGAAAQGTIQIEFGMHPDDFNGLMVEIDGEQAGELAAFGGAYRTAFAVTEGTHTVRVLHPRMSSAKRIVPVTAGGTSLLILTYQTKRTKDGQDEVTIGYEN